MKIAAIAPIAPRFLPLLVVALGAGCGGGGDGGPPPSVCGGPLTSTPKVCNVVVADNNNADLDGDRSTILSGTLLTVSGSVSDAEDDNVGPRLFFSSIDESTQITVEIARNAPPEPPLNDADVEIGLLLAPPSSFPPGTYNVFAEVFDEAGNVSERVPVTVGAAPNLLLTIH